MASYNIIAQLIRKGVNIPNPESVEIADDINIDNISGDHVYISAGTRIHGKNTLILSGAKIGSEGAVFINECQIGPDVELKSGSFTNAVFLKKASLGFASHVREGTILEEEAGAAHTVGLKQTILFPFVTLGSLINFCDCLMAGGTSRKNHSEVGSSYIHFNYTPNQDKATPSLLGDVPSGVMLNQSPIFLGGQGGLIGPTRLAFGTVIAAGSVCRRDELTPHRLIIESPRKSGSIPFIPGLYSSIKRIVNNNIHYIANLRALEKWVSDVRAQFISNDFPEPLFEGLRSKLEIGISERIKRLREISEKMPESIDIYRKLAQNSASDTLIHQKQQLIDKWPEIEGCLIQSKDKSGNERLRNDFLEKISAGITADGKEYIDVIRNLDAGSSRLGTQWLQGIVDDIYNETMAVIPSCK